MAEEDRKLITSWQPESQKRPVEVSRDKLHPS
jgi:hypothetical protein